MRLRNVPGARETIIASPLSVQNAEEWKGRWAEQFGNHHPIYIEVGMGKGKFIVEMAKRNPQFNYIGIEKYSSVLVRAVEKLGDFEQQNLRLIRMDAENLENVFGREEVAGIYLNFSDPWPKDRHAKRRLTSTRFLERYSQILREDGRVMFKTDNRALFDFSLEQIQEAGWILENSTCDLHHSEYMEGNVMTEYEEKFSAKGKPICRLCAYRNQLEKDCIK